MNDGTMSHFLRLTLLMAILAGSSACLLGGQSSESASFDDGNPPADPGQGPDGVNSQCRVDLDCDLAASTCCECPSFAVPSGQGFDDGCQDVQCEPGGLCPAVQATCVSGQCVMVCAPVVTTQVCAFGFQADAAGCLLNECASPSGTAPGVCLLDEECVQIPADCCGCSRGGADRAVLASAQSDELDGLACPANPACPEIDVCNPEQVPRCIAGSCALVESQAETPPDDGPILCGRPELPVCAVGTICVLNALSANDATQLGVGICTAP